MNELEEKIKLYKKVFNSPNGKKVLEDLEAVCGFKALGCPDNIQRIAYNKGLRDVYVYIIQQIESDPTQIVKQQEVDNAPSEEE